MRTINILMTAAVLLSGLLLVSGCGSGTLTDERDGKTYKTVKMPDGKTWMAQNLNYKPQPNNFSPSWPDERKSWCYGDNPNNCDTYGRLYDWATAMTICPAGYHLPSAEEWDSLMAAVGGKREFRKLENDNLFFYWNGVGNKLKAKTGWNSNADDEISGKGTNKFGFSALPGGYWDSIGSFKDAGNNGNWWTATYIGNVLAYRRGIAFGIDYVYEGRDFQSNGNSVRCVADNVRPHNMSDGSKKKSVSVTYDKFKDSRDGKTYKTVVIGGKRWMAQNLNYQTDSSWCYDNAKSNCVKYGRLYTWNAAMKACPAGYHLPSTKEWDSLMATVGGKKKYLELENDKPFFVWDGASNKLKTKTGWNSIDDDNISGNGTNVVGFSALPGGIRDPNGNFEDVGGSGSWWTATRIERVGAYSRGILGIDLVYDGPDSQSYGQSVRCVADNVHPYNMSDDSKKKSVSVTYNKFKDSRDGKTYKTVVIGGKRWMAQNLNYQTDSSWCYDNAKSNCVKYGRLYAWNAAMKACPAGYHLPSAKEWDSLMAAVGGKKKYLELENDKPFFVWDGAGNKLMAKTGWNSSDDDNISGNGTNMFGFSALPGGIRDPNGNFEDVGGSGSWWTATRIGRVGAYYRSILGDWVYEGPDSQSYGQSVRCVADNVRPYNMSDGSKKKSVSVTDDKFKDRRDGKTYKTVVIGGKRWMAQNLNYQTDGSWCYDNAKSNCVRYGRLYAWNAAMKACPAGYHLPSVMEWDSLAMAVGGKKNSRNLEKDIEVFEWDSAGKVLKAKEGWNWDYDNEVSGNGTDDYGFSALPSGIRRSNGFYYDIGYFGDWWTATEDSGGYAYVRYTYNHHDKVTEVRNLKSSGNSVRCVADS